MTRCLVGGGAADYAFVEQAALWRGAEAHRATQLLDLSRLNRKKLPARLEPYVHAYETFKAESHFVPILVEHRVKGIVEGELLTGRLDRMGLMRGVRGMLDLKLGALIPATALQLALYAHLYDPLKWWPRFAVRLLADGTYRLHTWPLSAFPTDLATAKAFVRVARWRKAHRLYTP